MEQREARPRGLTLRVWGAALLLAFAVWLLISFAGVLVQTLSVIFGAFLISLAMRPAADYLAQWRVPRWVTVLVIYAIILTLLGLLGGWTGSAVERRIAEIGSGAPEFINDAVDALQNLVHDVPLLEQVLPTLDQIGNSLTQAVQQAATGLLSAATGAGQFVLDMLVVVVLSIFFTVDKQLGRSLLETWVPARMRPRVSAVFSNSTERLQRWVVAQLVIVVYFGVTYGIGLVIIGVPFAGLIAVIGAIMELVPFIGGAIALALSIVAALTAEPIMVLWVVLLYIVVTQVEANVVQPQLYGHAVNVHPVLVIVALFFGGKVGGLFGALFAVPVVVVVTAIVQEFVRGDAVLDSAAAAEAAPPAEAAD